MKRAFTHIGFSCALTLIVINLIATKYVYIVTFGLAIFFVASLLFSKFRQAVAVPLCFGAALFACLVFITCINANVVPQQNLDNSSANVSLYFVDEGSINKDGDYVYTAKTISVKQNGAPQKIKLRVKSSDKIDAQPYQIINGTLSFYQLGDSAYSSYGYWGDNIFLSSKITNADVTDTYVVSLTVWAINIRHKIINTIMSKLSSDVAGISVALVTGDKSHLSTKVNNYFKYAGASHLMAVSGFHLTVVTGMLLFILRKLRLNDKLVAVLNILIIICFAMITGMPKSVVRAGIMMGILSVGTVFNKHSDSLNSLGIAVFILCLNPFIICDISAVLSVLSVLSLLIIPPYIKVKNKVLNYFISALVIALSVMVFTIPIMYLCFGYVSLSSLISNIVLVPVGSVSIVLTMLLVATNGIAPILYLTKICNKLLILLVKFFASLKYAVVDLSHNFGIVLAGVAILMGVCFLFNNKKLYKYGIVISSTMAVIGIISSMFVYGSQAKILICQNGSILVDDNKSVVVFLKSADEDYYTINQYLLQNNNTVDYFIVTDYDKYSASLINTYKCNNIISYQMYNSIMQNDNCNNYIVTTKYNTDYFKLNNDTFVANVNGVVVSSAYNTNATICYNNDFVYDVNGNISLDGGDIIYSVNDTYSFNVRRFDVWQK